LALVLIACSRKPGPVDAGPPRAAQGTRTQAKEQTAGLCPAQPAELKGTRGAGEPCLTQADCAPHCCDCTGTKNTWLGAACIDGACAGKADACSLTHDTKSCAGVRKLVSHEQHEGSCGSPERLTGKKKEGEACGSETECTPVCCSCNKTRGAWLAAACLDGVCGSGLAACDLTRDEDKLCQGGKVSSSTVATCAPTQHLMGTKQANEACESFSQCASHCCTCKGSGKSYRAAACVDGGCADKERACQATASACGDGGS
jgi:hypothetical protein